MVIAASRLDKRRSDEVKYYGQGEHPSEANVTRMDSRGGWLARPSDLAALTNTSRGNSKIGDDLDTLNWDMVRKVKSWHVA